MLAVRELFRAANRILLPLMYKVNQTDRDLRLPHDYQYEDAKPKSVVEPATLFGNTGKEGETRKDVYANWLTSRKNAGVRSFSSKKSNTADAR